MTITTRLIAFGVVVAAQDRAIAFYRDVLGCEVRTDVEIRPGASSRSLPAAHPSSSPC